MDVRERKEEMKTIVCFGDSNTHGYDAQTNGRFDWHTRWTGQLQNRLGEGYAVREEGLSGRTTVFDDPFFEGLCGLQLIYPCLMSHEPVDLLIVMLGTNDVKQRFSATPENIAKGMERLLTRVLSAPECWADQPEILLVCPPPIEEGLEQTAVYGEMGDGCREKSLRLSELYGELAKRLQIHFLDAGSIEGMSMNPIDHMHLNEEAHAVLARVLEGRVRRILA